MTPPDTEAAQEPVPEDLMRRVAREEARAVYDEYTVTDDDGKQWTFPEVVDTISEIEGGTTRRTFAKAALAMAYITAGGAGYTAIMQAASQPAQAAATGELGTTTEPIDKIFADEIGTSANPITAIATGQIDNDDYHEKVVTQSGSTGNLDLSSANFFEQTVTGNITFSFNNPEATPAGNSFLLTVIQDGTGGHTLSWPAAVEWGGGSAPGVSTAANDKHIFSFVSPDGGTTWYGFVAAENVA